MFGLPKTIGLTVLAAGLICVFSASLTVAASQNSEDELLELPVSFEHDASAMWLEAGRQLMRLKKMPDHSQDIDILKKDAPVLFGSGAANPEEAKFKQRNKVAIEFLKSQFDEEYARLDISKKNPQIAPPDRIKSLWQNLKKDAATLEALAEAKITDVWLMDLIWQDVAENFAALKHFPFADRLKALGISRDEYCAAVRSLIAGLEALRGVHDDYERQAITSNRVPFAVPGKGGTTFQVIRPGNVSKNMSVRIVINGQIVKKNKLVSSADLLAFDNAVDCPGYVVAKVSAPIKVLSADAKEWKPLAVGDHIAGTDIFMVEGETAALLTLKDTRYAELKPGAIITFWEIDLTLPDETVGLIKDLISRLGSEQYRVRQAADDELTALGRVAIPYLRKALKDSDPEISNRAADIIYRIQEIKPRSECEKKSGKAGK